MLFRSQPVRDAAARAATITTLRIFFMLTPLSMEYKVKILIAFLQLSIILATIPVLFNFWGVNLFYTSCRFQHIKAAFEAILPDMIRFL